MSTPTIYQTLSDSELQEWLKYNKDFLSTVDETIELTPVNASASAKQNILRFLFMDSRSAAYDICVLAESLLTNDRHHFSRAIEASRRLLMENTIDYFYISESDNSVAEQRVDFMRVVNTPDDNEKKRKEKAFKKKYQNTGRGDFWSGKSREEKVEQGLHKYPPVGKDTSLANMVKPIFANLNEQVHGNTMVASYFNFNKHREYADEYRKQVTLGLLTVSVLFYLLLRAYCNFNGRGSEIKRFDFYYSYIGNLLIKDSEETNSEGV